MNKDKDGFRHPSVVFGGERLYQGSLHLMGLGGIIESGEIPSMVIDEHYTCVDDENLRVVAIVIPEDKFLGIKERLARLRGADRERYIWEVVDENPKYYRFRGSCYFMKNGLAQSGTAVTTNISEGFDMVRLFSRDLDSASALREEVGLFER